MIIQGNSHYLTYTLLFRKVGRMNLRVDVIKHNTAVLYVVHWVAPPHIWYTYYLFVSGCFLPLPQSYLLIFHFTDKRLKVGFSLFVLKDAPCNLNEGNTTR